jgi:hypothetical protein
MEHEIDLHEGEHPPDRAGQRIGVLAAVIAVLLGVVTIQSHRTHTQAVIVRTEANDQWSFYQAKKLKGHTLELGSDILGNLPQTEKTAASLERYKKEMERYSEEAKEIQKEVRAKEKECALAERQALRYDLGEGFLELGLVLCSLYFISKKGLFPVLGVVSAVSGAVLALRGFLMR